METSNKFLNNGKEVITVRISEIMDIGRYSSLIKLLRVTAWLIRFKDSLRRTSVTSLCVSKDDA